MAHIRQSRPDSGLCFQVKVLRTFPVVPSSLERGNDLAMVDWSASSRKVALFPLLLIVESVLKNLDPDIGSSFFVGATRPTIGKTCEDRVLGGPTSVEKGSKGRNRM